jgi:hypothetical protein
MISRWLEIRSFVPFNVIVPDVVPYLVLIKKRRRKKKENN